MVAKRACSEACWQFLLTDIAFVDLAFVELRLPWCLRCRTQHPCLDSNATLWKNAICNLAISSVLVHLSSNIFWVNIVPLPLNNSGWINCLGWKPLRFRWVPKGSLKKNYFLYSSSSGKNTKKPFWAAALQPLQLQQLRQFREPWPETSEMSQFVWEEKSFAPKIFVESI